MFSGSPAGNEARGEGLTQAQRQVIANRAAGKGNRVGEKFKWNREFQGREGEGSQGRSGMASGGAASSQLMAAGGHCQPGVRDVWKTVRAGAQREAEVTYG